MSPAIQGAEGQARWRQLRQAQEPALVAQVHGVALASVGRRPYERVYRRQLISVGGVEEFPGGVVVIGVSKLDAGSREQDNRHWERAQAGLRAIHSLYVDAGGRMGEVTAIGSR